ncbi:MAG: hypothetical protein ACREBF_00020 [Candidatus Micrarchaeales archaeon]
MSLPIKFQKNLTLGEVDPLTTKQEQIVPKIGEILKRQEFDFHVHNKELENAKSSQRKIFGTVTRINRCKEEDTYKVVEIPIGHLSKTKIRYLKDG